MRKNIIQGLVLVKLIHKLVSKNKYLQVNKKILLAFSGGQDSMALLYIFFQIKNQRKYQLGLFYCNHLWQFNSFYTLNHVVRLSFLLKEPIHFIINPRTEFSFSLLRNKTKLKSSRMMSNLKLLYFYSKQFTSSYKKKKQFFTEEKSRDWRYQSCQRISSFYEYQIISFGHTASDRIETSFFNFLRGAGTKGVSSLHWIRFLKNLYPKNFYFSNFYEISYKKF